MRVRTFAQAAQDGPWQLPTLVRAEVTQQEARALAMCGEPLKLVEQKLDEAHQLLRAARRDDERQFGNYYDEDTFALRRASCYLEARKPGEAAELFSEVLHKGLLSRRDEGYFRARRAVALALSGEPDDAAQEGLSSWQIVAITRSQRTTRELARAVTTLTPWNDRPGLQELREALRA